jgi:OOP family OmpA-OmpF porin
MAVNLLDMLQSSVGQSLVGEASKYLGESEATTRSALGAALPALLAGFVQQGSTGAGASRLYEMITGPAVDTGLLGNLGAWLGGTKAGSMAPLGESVLNLVVPGKNAGALASAVSAISGMKASSVTALLGAAAPVLLAFIKNILIQGKLDAGGLASLLSGQQELLEKRLDDRTASALGFSSVAGFVSSLSSGVMGQAAGTAGRLTDAARDVGRGATQAAGTAYATTRQAVDRLPEPTPVFKTGWFWGVAAALVLVAWWLFNTGTSIEQSATNVANSVARSVKAVELPGGDKLEVSAGGFLDSLAAFLAAKNAAPGTSFTFDDLQFETGSSTLSASSARQLEQLASVLRAYPNVAVNVGGHTDNAGDAEANRKLSADRAVAVQQALVGMGIPAARVSAEGYGPDKPVAPNDTEEGRTKNRRVDLMVSKL